MKTDTPETDGVTYDIDVKFDHDDYVLDKYYTETGDHVSADFGRKIERERDAALEDVKKWKHHFITFACIHAAAYGKEHYGDGYMHPTHYDMLKEAGARMDDFKRAESNPPIMP